MNEFIGGWQERFYAIKGKKLFEYKKKTAIKSLSVINILNIVDLEPHGKKKFDFVNLILFILLTFLDLSRKEDGFGGRRLRPSR